MLIGRFDARVGAKNRIALPIKFREILGDKLIITQGYENSLIIVSQKNWEELLEGTAGKPFIQSEARETRRFLLGGASSIELDSKGRFIIPQYLREFGKIEEEIIFLGLYGHIELWDKKRWQTYSKDLEKNIDKISQRLVEDIDSK